MNRIILLILALLPLPLLAQQYLDKTAAEVKTAIKTGAHPVKINKETKTSLTYSYTRAEDASLSGELIFDEKGICITEKMIATCDSCLDAKLNALLATTKYQWKKINENQYVSDFNSGLMLELPPDGKKNTYKLMRMHWSKELYELLMKN